jgi:signal transduction histidine kinase/DNA-binding response OmpR family regulator
MKTKPNSAMRAGRIGIFFKTAMLSWLVTILTVGMFAAVILPQQKQTFFENLESKARVLSLSLKDLASGAVAAENYDSVVNHCTNLIAGDESIEFLVVTRNDGFSLIQTRTDRSRGPLSPSWYPRTRTVNFQMERSNLVDLDVFRYSLPLDSNRVPWGWIHIGLSIDSYLANVRESCIRTASLGGICILIGLVVSVAHAMRIVKPILNLRNVARQVADGDLNARAQVHSGDEVEALAVAFNAMTQTVQDREKRVRRQNLTLASLVADSALHSGNIRSASARITEASAQTIGAARTGIWLFREDLSGIECIDLFISDIASHQLGDKLDRCGCEPYFIAMQQSRTLSVEDAATDPRTACMAGLYLEPENISSILDAPIRRGGAVVGVVRHEHIGPPRRWTLEEENFAGSVADLMALALEARDRQAVQEALRSAKDAAEAASEAKSRFLANMSHEIRTPLNGVVGMLKLLRTGQLDNQQKRFVNKGIISAKALLVVINDVLDFSKIEAGKLELEMLPIDIVEITENTVQTFAFRAEEKSLDLVCSFHCDVPSMVIGDPTRVGQVLSNLISNAIKFTRHGSVTVRVGIEHEDAESIELGFRVEDTGVGIAAGERDRIFEPFLQGDSSTTRRFGGTGLGLGICRNLVHLMGGDIHVDSQPGVGSVFRFTTRFVKVAQSRKACSIKGMRVLIVDDHPGTREVLSDVIESWGGHPAEAESGSAALSLMRKSHKQNHPFDLVIVDWNMPGMSGEELGQRIQADPLLAGIPLILLSSIGEIDGSHLRQAGFTTWLSKPARQSELYDAILNTVNKTADPAAATRLEPGRRTALRPGLQILLAEDNEINQEVVDEILKASGCVCRIVNNGREAVDALASEPYDVVLMDCMMPEMDGYQASRLIREKENGSPNRIPIIALTANAMKGDREQCINAGMDDYLSKPLDPDRTLEVIRKWTEKNDGSEQPGPGPACKGPGDLQEMVRFDRTALLKRCMGNRNLAEKLIEKFMDQADHDLRELSAAFANNETAGVIAMAHRIKGAAANLSMDRLSQIAGQAEARARDGRLDGMREEIQSLKTEILRIQDYFASTKTT